MNHDAPPSPFLRREYRRARQTLLFWSAGCVVTAVAVIAGTRLAWLSVNPAWAAAPAVLSAILLGWWIKRANRFSRSQYACELDARWGLRSRLETAVELAQNDSALAQAQRMDAKDRFSDREDVGAIGWIAATAMLTLSLVFCGVEGSVLAVRALRAKPAAGARTEKVQPHPATPELSAAIEWKTPAREIKATAIEEVPLTAIADSSKGFHGLTLEILVNGRQTLSRPLDATAVGGSGEPGPHELRPSLYVDETGAKPFDIVSYHLTGELIGGTSGRRVSSPLQFIQIRPPQRDAAKLGHTNPDAIRVLSMLSALKLGQLELIDANFSLERLAEENRAADWQKENARATADQADLSKRAEETREFAASKRAPALIPGNLAEARTSMLAAVSALEAGHNHDATQPQGHALALITECEKIFREALEVTGDIPPVSMLDPFGDEQVFKLEPRTDTPAGQLETLVTRQGSLIQQLGKASGSGGSSVAGVLTSEKQIAQDAQRLAGSGQLIDAAQALATTGAGGAAAAAIQLEANDRSAAREPAGNALADLQKAVAAQERAGRAMAVAELARLRIILNAASREGGVSERTAKLVSVRNDLRAAAEQQQRTGSAEAALQLKLLAEAVSAAEFPGSLSTVNSRERAHDLAVAAAHTQVALSARAAATKRALRLVKRGAGTVETPGAESVLPEVEIGSQEAEWLTTSAATSELAREVSAQSAALQARSEKPGSGGWQSLGQSAAKLADALEIAQSIGLRDEVVRRFSPDEIDPAYRDAVEAYFERLSREVAPPATAAPKP